MPYPGDLGAKLVHVALLTYPSEGGAVNFTVVMRGVNITTDTVTIPAGTSAYVHNISCPICYAVQTKFTISVVPISDPSSQVALVQDTDFAVTSLRVTEASLESQPASINAAFSGLSENAVYSLGLWCSNPAMDTHTTYTAT